MWCVYHYPAFICRSWSDSFQQIMTTSMNWTQASLQEPPRPTDHWAERLLDLWKLAIHLPYLKLLVLPSQLQHSTLDHRLSSEAPFDLPKGGRAIQKQLNATSNVSLPNSSRKGLSVARSLRKYQQRGKLLQWQVHLNLKWLETLALLVKASLNAGYMFVFFSLFYKHTASNPQATRPGLKVVNMLWHFRSTQQWPKKAWRSFLKPNTSSFAYATHSKQSSISMLRSRVPQLFQVSRVSNISYFMNCNPYLWYETIAEFYFNFKTSIFGQVIPSPMSNSRPLPHLYFIATPLLPCGPVDPKVKKFTGNGPG